MKFFSFVFSFLVAVTFLTTTLFAQLPAVEKPADETEEANQTDNDRVVHPMADPYVYYDPYDPVFSFQAGIFASTAEYGAELTFINRPYNFFGTFYLGDSFKPENRVPGAASLYTGGVTLGKQFLFNASATNYDGTLFYARIGTGVGFAGISGNTTRGSNTYYGLNTTAIAGAMKGISGLGSLYVEMGTRAVWFPTFEERSVLGAPHLSIGFMFSGTRNIIPVRF